MSHRFDYECRCPECMRVNSELRSEIWTEELNRRAPVKPRWDTQVCEPSSSSNATSQCV